LDSELLASSGFFSSLWGEPEFRSRAAEQMTAYKPADSEDTTNVAPLVQFFELVHIGDTIQSMVQVYFDKELVSGSFFFWFYGTQ
jgi:hypothetical protein